ncbi:MAG: nucleotidyltransferase domain-containing protein [archaeon]
MGKEEYIRILKKFKEKLKGKIKVEKMILFGSRAVGDNRKDSDIDLLIVSSSFNGKNFFDRVKKMYNYWDLDYAVDFLCYTPEEFEKLSKKISIVTEALKTGVEIK